MNEITKKLSIMIKLQNYLKENYLKIIYLGLLFFFIFLIFQLYNFYNNKKILSDSINYNIIKSSNFDSNYDNMIIDLSNKKNFYSILITLENIKLKINSDLESAYSDYLLLLNNKILNNNYKSIIGIQGSYLFLNNYNQKLNDDEILKLINKINTLLSFVDSKLTAYDGPRLEILYLLSIIDNEINNNNSLSQESENIFNQINSSDDIAISIKERVKKINDFQKYQ